MENITASAKPVDWESLLDKPRIYVDLNSGGKDGSHYVVPLNRRGTVDDLQKRSVTLQEDLSLDFWTDDGDEDGAPDPLIFSGCLHFDGETNQWVAVIKEDEFRYASHVRQRQKMELVTVSVEEVRLSHTQKKKALSEPNKRII